jgi:hypothetical protein
MLDPVVVAGLPADVLAGVPGFLPGASASLSERDEFGAFDGTPGVLRAAAVPAGLAAREDLGHALCAWLPREDLL